MVPRRRAHGPAPAAAAVRRRPSPNGSACRSSGSPPRTATLTTAWSLTAATERRFFTEIFKLPVPIFAHRGLEKSILVARRPDLAAIPLDTDSFACEPLLAEHLDRRVLADVLPPPDHRLWSRSPLRAGGPIRLLCGLAFVLDQRP